MINFKNDKYYLFFDLDNTIADRSFPMNPQVIEAINAAQKTGHKIFINTGRTLGSIRENVLNPIRWDGIICGCGAHIILDNKTVYSKKISARICHKIAKTCFNLNQNCIFEGEKTLLLINLSDAFGQAGFIKTQSYKDFKQLLKNDNITKLTFMGKEPVWFKKYSKIFDIITHPTYVETAFKGYSKAKGIEILKDLTHFDIDKTISFGDSNNDLEMLKATKYCVVMGQAEKNIIDIADFVTDTYENNGVAKFINENLI